jgi:hypothetical protein
MLAWFGFFACAPQQPVGAGSTTVPTTPAPPSAPTTPPDGSDTTPPDSEPAADAVLARAIIDGTAPAEETLATLAWSGGLPVETAPDTFMFLYTGGSGPVEIAGDFDGWAAEPMAQGANGVWWIEVAIPAAAGVRYKVVDDGSWIADPHARSYTYDENGEMSYVRPPGDTWRLDRWPGMYGQGLAARDLRVYVPADSGVFPVLYAHDGQNLFDPGAFWGGWRLQDALATVDPMIVVGIDNTPDRFDEYTHVPDDVGYGPMGGNGDAYAAFVHDDVRPFIEATYGSSGLDGVLGSSLGGLISLHIAQKNPADWDFAASMSGTLGWGKFRSDEVAMEDLWLGQPAGFTHVYLDSGGSTGPDGLCRDIDGDGFPEDDPDSSDNYCETRQMADDLAAAGWVWDETLVHWWEPDAEHNELSWSQRVDIPLAVFAALDD